MFQSKIPVARTADVPIQKLENILVRACRAPSGDNSQPWRFEWDGKRLTIFFCPSRAHHVLDAGRSASRLALGCLLESIEIAAGSSGYSTSVALSEFATDAESACATVVFESSSQRPDPLVDALDKRWTDRRPFLKGSLPFEALRQAAGQCKARGSSNVHFLDAISGALLDYLVAAESLVAIHPSIFPDTLPWIRMSRQEIQRTSDGMPWRGVGVQITEYPLLRIMHAAPKTFSFFKHLGMKSIQQQRVRRQIRSSAGLLCYSAPARSEPAALVNAGRLALRLWLSLSAMGYGVQPLTISSLSIYNLRANLLDEQSRELFGRRFEEGESLLRGAFALSPDQEPVWLFRTGVSTPPPAAWRTLRRDLSTTLRIISGAV